MESNIVEFRPKVAEVVEEYDPVVDFVHNNLLPWAMNNNLDIHSMKFKLNGATIMACLQGMLLDDV